MSAIHELGDALRWSTTANAVLGETSEGVDNGSKVILGGIESGHEECVLSCPCRSHDRICILRKV